MSIPFETRWTVETTPFTLSAPQGERSFPTSPAHHAPRIADTPDTPPPRLS
jgi:hypothetical protein